jgi:hypothetical protein
MMKMARVLKTFYALTVFLLFALLGQGTPLRGSILLVAEPQSAAVAPGAHCPLMSHADSQTQPVTPHCPMHETAGSRRAEWRCVCGSQSPTATPDTALTRFLLPSLVAFLAPPNGVFEPRETRALVPTPVFSPPDPPPRVLLSILV